VHRTHRAHSTQCFPCGTKNETKASCYCGEVVLHIKTDQPVFAGFCHCKSCRKAHSAPLYQCVYVKPEEITVESDGGFESPFLASKGGKGKLGEFSVVMPIGLKHRRVFCNNCGSTMFNDLTILEGGTLHKGGAELIHTYGTFPATYDTPMTEMIQSWRAWLCLPLLRQFLARAGVAVFLPCLVLAAIHVPPNKVV
jgi:hypothetical protein